MESIRKRNNEATEGFQIIWSRISKSLIDPVDFFKSFYHAFYQIVDKVINPICYSNEGTLFITLTKSNYWLNSTKKLNELIVSSGKLSIVLIENFRSDSFNLLTNVLSVKWFEKAT